MRWMEEARCDFLEQIGLGYDVMERAGILSPVLSVACEYKSMTRFPDTVLIFLRMTFLPAGLAAWALYDVYHFNPFLAILIALPGLAWMLIGGAGLAIAGLLERLKKNNRIDHHNQIYVDTSSEKEAFNDNCSKAEMKSNDEVPDSSDKSTLEQSEIHPDIVTCPLENIENNVDTGEAIPTDESRSIYGDIKSTGVERALTLILLMCVLSFVIFCGFNLIRYL